MDFMIFDTTGNAVAAYPDALSASDALRALVIDDPEAGRELALFAFDEEGHAVGEAVVGADVAPEYAGKVSLTGTKWLRYNAETFVEVWTRTFGGELKPATAGALEAV
jgi:hypothetical protein